MDDVPTTPAGPAVVRGPEQYEIRVKGHIAPRWAPWFDGMTLTAGNDGITLIHGPVADQAALHGLLRTCGDIGLPLVSVAPTKPGRRSRI